MYLEPHPRVNECQTSLNFPLPDFVNIINGRLQMYVYLYRPIDRHLLHFKKFTGSVRQNRAKKIYYLTWKKEAL